MGPESFWPFIIVEELQPVLQDSVGISVPATACLPVSAAAAGSTAKPQQEDAHAVLHALLVQFKQLHAGAEQGFEAARASQAYQRVCRSMPANLAAPAPRIPRLLSAYFVLGSAICGPRTLHREFKTLDFLSWIDCRRLPQWQCNNEGTSLCESLLAESA